MNSLNTANNMAPTNGPIKPSRQPGKIESSTRAINIGNGLLILNLVSFALITVISLFPSNPFRIALAIPVVLFSPGYALTLTIFSNKSEIGILVRVVLSVVLSVSIVALIGLAISYLPWGINLDTLLYINVTVIFVLSLFGWLRQRSLAKPERFSIRIVLPSTNPGARLTDKLLTIGLLTLILIALSAFSFILATPKTGETYTDFYMLGASGQAGDYPETITAGQGAIITLGIANHEGTDTHYLIQVLAAGITTTEIGPVIVDDKNHWETDIEFMSSIPGQQKIEFQLFRAGDMAPYKNLHLWVDVIE